MSKTPDDPVSAEAIAAGLKFCCGREEKLALEISALRNVVQAAMNDGGKKVFTSWNYNFPDDLRDVPKQRQGSDLCNMISAMQNGEMTVSRGVELIDMWLAGNYSDDQLPPMREGLGEDEMPWDRIEALTKKCAELERLSVTNILIEVVPGEDGMGQEIYAKSPDDIYRLSTDICEKIETERQQRDELQTAYDAAHSELVRMTDQLAACRDVANATRKQRDDLLTAIQEIDSRLRKCFDAPITAAEAYDSFYQEIVSTAIANVKEQNDLGNRRDAGPIGGASVLTDGLAGKRTE